MVLQFRRSLIALFFVAERLAAQAGARTDDLQVLRDLRESYAKSYSSGDLATLRAMYADSAVRLPYDAAPQRGIAAIAESYASSFQKRKVNPFLYLVVENVTIDGQHAMEWGAYHETIQAVSGQVRQEDGKYVLVAVRSGAKWKYLWSTFNRDSLSYLRPPTK
jgi:ketosteroid isomerase-like protein